MLHLLSFYRNDFLFLNSNMNSSFHVQTADKKKESFDDFNKKCTCSLISGEGAIFDFRSTQDAWFHQRAKLSVTPQEEAHLKRPPGNVGLPCNRNIDVLILPKERAFALHHSNHDTGLSSNLYMYPSKREPLPYIPVVKPPVCQSSAEKMHLSPLAREPWPFVTLMKAPVCPSQGAKMHLSFKQGNLGLPSPQTRHRSVNESGALYQYSQDTILSFRSPKAIVCFLDTEEILPNPLQ